MSETALIGPDFTRRSTRPVRVGPITIGGGHPIVVQSMITEETRNVAGCVEQIIAMHKAGCEIVRVTTPTLAEAHCLGEIQAEVRRRGYRSAAGGRCPSSGQRHRRRRRAVRGQSPHQSRPVRLPQAARARR